MSRRSSWSVIPRDCPAVQPAPERQDVPHPNTCFLLHGVTERWEIPSTDEADSADDHDAMREEVLAAAKELLSLHRNVNWQTDHRSRRVRTDTGQVGLGLRSVHVAWLYVPRELVKRLPFIGTSALIQVAWMQQTFFAHDAVGVITFRPGALSPATCQRCPTSPYSQTRTTSQTPRHCPPPSSTSALIQVAWMQQTFFAHDAVGVITFRRSALVRTAMRRGLNESKRMSR
jgi:hypothetical protein